MHQLNEFNGLCCSICSIMKLRALLAAILLIHLCGTFGIRRKADGLECQGLDPISNGRLVVYSKHMPKRRRFEDGHTYYPTDTRLRYKCEAGYRLVGPKTQICESSGFWNTEPPVCIEDCGHSFYKKHAESSSLVSQWPWTAMISKTNGKKSDLLCTGVLLDKRTVLTAAHCVSVKRRKLYKLYFGKLSLSDDKDDNKVQKRKISRVIINPGFNQTTFQNNIAILKFHPEIQYSERIQPICLPQTHRSTRKNLSPDNKGYVAGWGRTKNKTGLSNEILSISVSTQPNEKCLEAFGQKIPISITRGMFCAGIGTADTNVCHIYSGSPLVYYDKKMDRYSIEGLVSFGSSTRCEMPKYAIYTKVGDYMPWITEMLH